MRARSAITIAFALWLPVSGGTARSTDQPTDDGPAALADSPSVERRTLSLLLNGNAWPRRALAAMRLERFGCEETRDMLQQLATDRAWQVRAFAARSLARRRVPDAGWYAGETEPLVVRAALRHRLSFDAESLDRGARALIRRSDLESKMLGVELALLSSDESLHDLAEETTRTIILRMSRVEAGALSPRLALLTGQPDLKKPYRWQRWLPGRRLGLGLRPGYMVPDDDTPIAPSILASMDSEQFAKLESYVEELEKRHVDLAICLDCTTSMWSELADAQGGIDDMMRFVGDVVGTLRVAIVAYRDKRDRFETRALPLTYDVESARRFLWTLTADGGGDAPESVLAAMRFAFTQLQWDPNHERVLVVVGDAPPHVGEGTLCVALAEEGKRSGWTTHVVEADDRPVKHFAEIAEAGGGQRVTLGDGNSVITEVTGLTLGEQFAEEMGEFFNTYLALCR